MISRSRRSPKENPALHKRHSPSSPSLLLLINSIFIHNPVVMEIVYVLLLLVIIYLLVTNKTSLNQKIERLETALFQLQQELKKQRTDTTTPAPPPPKPAAPAEDIKKPDYTQWEPTIIPKEPEKQPVPESPRTTPRPFIEPSYNPHKPAYKPAEPRQSFFERYPDLEKFIGENLINKIGIAILVLAIGFFVKYAIDNNWVGPAGRVGIGVLCGGILIGIAHRLRNSYKAFSSVLVGGGLAVLYFTITLAYHEFHLFDQTASFIILIGITCFAVALSLLYDKQELAVIALIGGLSSPFMVSSGAANYNALFIYLLILNTGLLVIAYFKSWRILNISAFGLTAIVFGAIISTLPAGYYAAALQYASVLYLLFFAINIANNIKENQKFIAADFTVLLVNTGLYFAVGLYLLTAMHQEQFRGLFSASLAVINLLLSYILFKNKKVDTNILYLLIGITLTFISLSAPIQLHGHYITLFWAAETVLLYWLYQKSGIQLMKLTSLAIWCAMLISLLMDWMSLYGSAQVLLPIIANKGFITTLFAAVSSFMLSVLISRDKDDTLYGLRIEPAVYKFSALALLFLSGLLEINHQFLTRYGGTSLNILYLMLYVPAFVYAFHKASKKVTSINLDWRISAAFITAAIAVYLLMYSQVFDLQYATIVQQKISPTHFMAHWIGAVFIGLLFYELVSIARTDLPEPSEKIVSWVLAAAIVLFLSLEVCLITNALFVSTGKTLDQIEIIYIKTGLPVLWGLLSFAMMWLGMRFKFRTLRIISLTLFSVTLLKLFIFDIENIPPAGKIAAFFCLGVLLLIISFMYQKIKKIVVDENDKKQA